MKEKKNIHTKETGYVYNQAMRMAAILLIVGPFFLMQDQLWLAAVVAIIGISCFDATNGVKVNITDRTVMLYTNVFGIHFGKARRLKKNECFLVTYIYRKEERKAKSLPENPLSLRDMEFYVQLSSEEQKPIKVIYKCFEEQEAMDFALFVGEELDMEVYDFYNDKLRRLRAKGDPPRFAKD